ncbi:MAG: DNRLRE domain-containing protein [Verrucomicrobiota bacterium]
MKNTLICLALTVFFVAGTPLSAQDIDPDSDTNVQPSSPTSLNGYRLAWSDEFNTPALNEAKWEYREGDDSRSQITSYQLAANNAVSGGLYRCILKKQTVGSKQFTAGGISSKKLFRYGYYESRLKCPPTSGWHTSFWMLPKYNVGPNSIELDVIENDSVNLDLYFTGVHRHKPAPFFSFLKGTVRTPNLHANFHTYGCEFTPDRVRYFFNGELVDEVDATPFSHSDMNIWLTSIGIVYDWDPPTDESQLPVEAQYDYVRYFELRPYATAEITSPDPSGVILQDTSSSVGLSATIATFNTSDTPTVLWSKVSGPGTVSFGDATSADTTASFSADGIYEISCAATIGSVTNSDTIIISVNAPKTVNMRQGVSDAATFIRADLPDRNNGADNELIVGNWNVGGMRGLLSFDLSSIESGAVIQGAELQLYNANGTGTVGAVEIRPLTAPFVEGTGDGSSDANGANSGATWNKRTGSKISVSVTTASGTVTDFTSIASVSGIIGADYVYYGAIPSSSNIVLIDDRVDTGLLNVADDLKYHFAETLSADHILAVVYNANTGSYYTQPATLTAYDSSGAQVGSPISIPDISASYYTTLNLARPTVGSELAGRGIYGFTLPVADFGGNPADIAYVTQSAGTHANSVDMHYIGSAVASGSILTAGVIPITAISSTSTPATNWTLAGGDFSSTVLSSIPGYNTTIAGYKTFPTSANFTAAVQSALDAGEPLNLIVYSPASEAGGNNVISRFASDDSLSSLERPMLTVSFMGSYVPAVNAGNNLGTLSGNEVSLSGNSTYTDTSAWTVIGGPGTVNFSDPASLTSTATFSAPGRYFLRLSGSNALGTGAQDISVSVIDSPPALTGTLFSGPNFMFDAGKLVNGLDYTVQWSNDLNGTWTDLYDINATGESQQIIIPVSANEDAEYYRLQLKP